MPQLSQIVAPIFFQFNLRTFLDHLDPSKEPVEYVDRSNHATLQESQITVISHVLHTT